LRGGRYPHVGEGEIVDVLLVGGGGYLGSVLVRELIDRGYTVKVFDRFYYGQRGLDDVRDRVEVIVGDIRTMSPNVLQDVDAVINLAGLSNDPTADFNPQANFEMNTLATRDLALLCKMHGIQRFVFASSCSLYDIGVGNDEADIVFTEESPVTPRAAYSTSKYEAERILLGLADEHFSPVILRMGTLFGFSPRMRYDLVVNTFVKDALQTGAVTMHNGGEMWRPLCDVHDAARSYLVALAAPLEDVHAQIFNVSTANYRISELALRVREGLRATGKDADIRPQYVYQGVRSYRVSAAKIRRTLNFVPAITVEDSVRDMVARVQQHGFTDFDNPLYYNIRQIKVLEEAASIIGVTGSVFGIDRGRTMDAHVA
jgi:nucleoside-diphosphate-sugar epimerase